jgi:hypothetical protein
MVVFWVQEPWVGGVAQAVDLPRECKALCSNLSTTKMKKRHHFNYILLIQVNMRPHTLKG